MLLKGEHDAVGNDRHQDHVLKRTEITRVKDHIAFTRRNIQQTTSAVSSRCKHYYIICTFICACVFISERELTFTFAICYRTSACRLSVCRLSSVRNARPLKISRRSSQRNPSTGGVKHKRGSQVSPFRTYRRLYLGNGAR